MNHIQQSGSNSRATKRALTLFHRRIQLGYLQLEPFNAFAQLGGAVKYGARIVVQLAEHVLDVLAEAAQLADDARQRAVRNAVEFVLHAAHDVASAHIDRLDGSLYQRHLHKEETLNVGRIYRSWK